MRRITTSFLTAMLCMTVALPAWAQDKFELVEERIRELAPSARSIAVSETPVAGLLQVQINGEIVYATDDGRYMLQGRVIDLDTREDLTEQSKARIRKELLDEIDVDKLITFTPAKATYDLTVFTDIDCGYCRKLHAQMDEYNEHGIAIHYMAFPRAGVGTESFNKAVSVWCADDQQSAMTDAKAGKDPKPSKCDNPVADQYQLGIDLGVTGTPALLTTSGELIPGYVPPAALRERLDKMNGIAAAE